MEFQLFLDSLRMEGEKNLLEGMCASFQLYEEGVIQYNGFLLTILLQLKIIFKKLSPHPVCLQGPSSI